MSDTQSPNATATFGVETPANAEASIYASDAPPDTSEWNSEQKASYLKSWEASLARNPNHPLFDASHPKHSEAVAFRASLYESAKQADAVDPPMSEHDASIVSRNHVPWGSAKIEGASLTEEQVAEVHQAFSAGVAEAGLDRVDTGRLAVVLRGAIGSATRGPVDYDSAMETIKSRVGGEERALQVVRDANEVLAFLKERGLQAAAGLRRLGLANSPDLTIELARHAERVRQLTRTHSANKATGSGTLLGSTASLG